LRSSEVKQRAGQIEALRVADPAVDHLEAVAARCVREVPPLERAHGETAERAVPGRTDSDDSTANHHEVVLPRGQLSGASSHLQSDNCESESNAASV
jgi:hypothetical protein